MITEHDAHYSEDYYEILQVTPDVDQDSVERSYKILARQYHPDNQETGDPEKFMQVVRAYKILSDPEARAVYDRRCEENPINALALLDETSENNGYEGDQRLFDLILTLLYSTRRKNLRRSGMGVVHLEQVLGYPSDDLEFHMWYLREKGCVERLENGLYAITVEGVDRIIEQQARLARRKKRAQKLSRPRFR